MEFSPRSFLHKKIGELHIPAKVRGKSTTAHIVRSGKTVERYIFLYATATKTGEYGGTDEKVDICVKCVKGMITDD